MTENRPQAPKVESITKHRRAKASAPAQQLDSVEEAIADYQRGEFVIIVDDEDRENEGDLCIAAQFATPEHINFMLRYARGLICVPMTGERLDQLRIPMMVQQQPGHTSAPPSPSPSKPATASRPASPPPTAPAPSRSSSTPTPPPTTS